MPERHSNVFIIVLLLFLPPPAAFHFSSYVGKFCSENNNGKENDDLVQHSAYLK